MLGHPDRALAGAADRVGSASLPFGIFTIRIALIAHIRHPIAPPFMGGMESHFHGLARGLDAAGHSVTSFAAGGSDLPNLKAICTQPCEEIYPRERFAGSDALQAYQLSAFRLAWDCIASGNFDAVHNNSLFPEVIDWAVRDGIAMVTSQHVPPFKAMREKVHGVLGDERQQITVTSRHQKGLWSADDPPNLSVVHNGIDLTRWQPSARRHDRLLWYGRITPNKGLALAIKSAAIADRPLDIIGTIEDRAYFEVEIAPYLTGKIRYLGHLSGPQLHEAVAASRAVVATPMWDEPFGLVAAEALSSGVPVLAFDRGALREVVGPCGIIVPAADIAALARAMQEPDLPGPSVCRQRAEQCFSITQMIAGYERCYCAAMKAQAGTGGDSSASSAFKTTLLLA
ncbi:glycosyltransferase [Altererythrobacter confluentis]|uniref:Glycosyltransferase n=1 Tax=Allopontixanthobacter confluentis TaxID=1849021 RepID=A0A6L7GDP3_9SPHN|nr:glycosyltransferase [Allopontixanthobacter confluentis]